jgi:hypothetical protein
MKDTVYKYGKEFSDINKLAKYLVKIENLEDAKIIRADSNGNFVLVFNKNE